MHAEEACGAPVTRTLIASALAQTKSNTIMGAPGDQIELHPDPGQGPEIGPFSTLTGRGRAGKTGQMAALGEADVAQTARLASVTLDDKYTAQRAGFTSTACRP